MCNVLSSAAQTKVAGIFHNARPVIPIRNLLHVLQHLHRPIPIKIDYSTATGFIYDNIHQKRSKSWDMRYYWLRDHQTKNQVRFYWDKGTNSNAHSFTKHYATKYQRITRNRYVQDLVVFFIQRQRLPYFPTPSVFTRVCCSAYDITMTFTHIQYTWLSNIE